jgi:dTDP-4-dehydrorhamnose 3,5-epimerase
MKATPVPAITGVWLFEPTPHVDQRGFFCRTFDRDVVASVGIDPDGFVQDSVSRSAKGVLRGMHLRSGAGEAKRVRCSYGAVSTSSSICGPIPRHSATSSISN